jgi:hypothetical protein
MATCDPQVLMTAAKCFAPLPGNQLQILTTALLAEILAAANPMADTSPQALMDAAACFACLNPGQLAIINTQLLCEILNAGGGGGGNGCILSGAVDPTVAVPGCTDALYVNRVTGSFWYWDNVLLKWFSLIV